MYMYVHVPVLLYKKLSVKIVFLVNDGLFEHFLINKVHENVKIRGIENIQLPFRAHGNVLCRTCYRMYSCVKFKHIFLFYQNKNIIHKRGLVVWFHFELGTSVFSLNFPKFHFILNFVSTSNSTEQRR